MNHGFDLGNAVFLRNGQMVNRVEYHHADCGVRFSEYVQRTRKTAFPYCQSNGGRMEHTDLWQGRPLKVLLHKDASRWRMAKVQSFSEWLSGPHSRVANWEMTIQFTDTEDNENSDSNPSSHFTTGDVVKIHGLQSAKQHNGQEGYVSKFVTETGRFAVNYKDDKRNPVCIAVKPCNIRQVESMDTSLIRCNIEGGGTIQAYGIDQVISFEWLQEATPKVNLYEDGWCVKCPTCCATTLDHEMAVQNDEELNNNNNLAEETECPVCLETKQCLPLGNCRHFLCSACFEDCKAKANGSPIFRIQDIQVDDSPEELTRQREELQELTQWERSTEADLNRILDYMQNIMDATNDNDRESLIALKRWLLVHPIHIWCVTGVLNVLVDNLEANAAAIVCEQVEHLKGTEEFQEFIRGVMEQFRRSGGTGGTGISLAGVSGPLVERMNDHIFYHNFLMMHVTEWVGWKYQSVKKDFRAATSWYEKNVSYSSQYPADLAPSAMSVSLSNLGLAQQHSGLFNSAEANYRRAIEKDATAGDQKLLVFLQDELEKWRGTSGTVPRMEE